MDDSTVDILLASYNGEAYIAEQIDSILAQTHRNWRLIIGDDGSTDQTIPTIHRYIEKGDRKIFLANFSGRAGVVSNFSRLAEISEAPYLMFADQDDIWFGNKVEKTLEKMKQLEKIHGSDESILVFTDAVVVNNELQPISPSYWHHTVMNPKRTKLPQLLMQCAILGCTVMINRPLFNLAFPIPPEATMHDYWLGLIAGTFGVIKPLNEPTLYYRHHSNNIVGAVKKAPFINMIKMIKNREIPKGLNRVTISKIITAYMVYRRYGALFDDQTKEIYQAFITMKNKPIAKEVFTRLRYGFLRGGPLMNLHDFLVSYLMGPLPKRRQMRL